MLNNICSNNRNLLSHGSEAYKPETKVSWGWLLLRAVRENASHASLLASGSFPDDL